MIRLNAALTASASVLAALAVSLMLPEPVAAAMLNLPVVSVPEPATAALIATGVAGVVVEARRRKNKRDD